MVDWNDLQPLIGQAALVCMPMAVINIVRKYLHSRAKWRSNYVKAYISTQHYEIPTKAEFDPIEDEIDKFLEETATVSVCDDLITEMQNIVTKMDETKTAINSVNTTLAAMDLTPLTNLANIPVVGDFNDLEEEMNAIIAALGGTEVVLT